LSETAGAFWLFVEKPKAEDIHMAAEYATPLDLETGIPLPIMPRADLPPVPRGRGGRNLERIADWHHPFHPRPVLLAGDQGDQAVRHCRTQWADYEDHHHRYHNVFVGPTLPESAEEQFRTVVLAAAGYVPDHAIAFNDRRATIKPLQPEAREFLWKTGQIRVAGPADVRNFLFAYTLRHDFSGINNRTIDEFLNSPSMQRRRELGRTLLGLAARDAARPVQDIYRDSLAHGLIPSDRARTAGRFVFSAMTPYKGVPALRALSERLAI